MQHKFDDADRDDDQHHRSRDKWKNLISPEFLGGNLFEPWNQEFAEYGRPLRAPDHHAEERAHEDDPLAGLEVIIRLPDDDEHLSAFRDDVLFEAHPFPLSVFHGVSPGIIGW